MQEEASKSPYSIPSPSHARAVPAGSHAPGTLIATCYWADFVELSRTNEELAMKQLAGGKTDADILRFLEGISFPVHKDDIVHVARKNGAPNDIVGTLEQLPANEFTSAQELIDTYPTSD
jgi:Protein of unknown function (DUF2795)